MPPARLAAPVRSQAAPPAQRRPPPPATDVARILRLQQTAGNRAVTAMIQRLDVGDVWDVVKGPLFRGPFGGLGGILDGPGTELAFDAMVASNRSGAMPFRVPPSYVPSIQAYATVAPEDGKILLAALARKPRFHVGGWILDVQQGAEAMTLDTDVFCVGAPSVDTFVHELVHVKQYGDVGPIKFLTNYFGEVGWKALKALIAREEIDMFKASTYEQEGYALEQRFKYWRENLGR